METGFWSQALSYLNLESLSSKAWLKLRVGTVAEVWVIQRPVIVLVMPRCPFGQHGRNYTGVTPIIYV
jgi:hypothetical protein